MADIMPALWVGSRRHFHHDGQNCDNCAKCWNIYIMRKYSTLCGYPVIVSEAITYIDNILNAVHIVCNAHKVSFGSVSAHRISIYNIFAVVIYPCATSTCVQKPYRLTYEIPNGSATDRLRPVARRDRMRTAVLRATVWRNQVIDLRYIAGRQRSSACQRRRDAVRMWM